MIVDGRAIAEDIYKDLVARRAGVKRAVKLGIVVVGANPVIESFVRIKERAASRLDIAMSRIDVPPRVATNELIEIVKKIEGENDAIIVQLPLLKEIDTDAVLRAIPKEKDVDAINPAFPDADHIVEAPVALAVVEILKRNNVEIAAKRVVIVGSGRLVGAPTASLLKRLGATVSTFSLSEGAIEDLKDADIVVLGAGNPGFIKPEHLKKGAAVIDGGASEQAGRVVGDADPACAKVSSIFTPVPGGVGPIAVAMIFRNLFDLLDSKVKCVHRALGA